MTHTSTTIADTPDPYASDLPQPDRRPYWRRFTTGDGKWETYRGTERPPGEDLAALRAGAGRAPGTVPSMWRLMVWDDDEGYGDEHRPRPALIAEHHALVLYGIHQQSRDTPVHQGSSKPSRTADPDGGSTEKPDSAAGRYGLGDAVRKLHSRYSDEAVTRRFYAAVSADSVDALAMHLRGLVTQMRSLEPVAVLDYDQLYKDLMAWHHPQSRGRVRRSWGRQYHAFHGTKNEGTSEGPSSAKPDEQD